MPNVELSQPLRSHLHSRAVVGRRGGKSRIAAAIAVFVACIVEQRLAPGERGLCLLLAASVEQAKVVFVECHY